MKRRSVLITRLPSAAGAAVSAMAVALLTATPSFAAQPAKGLALRQVGDEFELTWPALVDTPEGRIAPIFELQRSSNLKAWTPFGERFTGAPGGEGIIRYRLVDTAPHGFYRLLTILPRSSPSLARDGAEVFGFSEQLAQELARIGQISPKEFEAIYSLDAGYLPTITWDPTTADYWEDFDADIALHNRGKFEDDPDYRATDFRLNEAELAVFRQNGFVVSTRLGSSNFAESFGQIWSDDLPVFISTDAILQAWHRSFSMMLLEIEETYLAANLERLLAGMASELPTVWAESGTGPLRESIQDADYYLAVARRLLTGERVDPVLLGQDRVDAAIGWIHAGRMLEVSDLFGACRTVDFSQFTPRGHYTGSDTLERYFRAMTWCGRIDIPVAGEASSRCYGSETALATSREAGLAIVLWHLLNASGEFDTWRDMDRVIGTFFGWTDSMTFAQLDAVLAAADIRHLADVTDAGDIERFQAALMNGTVGAQHIRSDFFISPFGPERIRLPRTFTVFGQRFAPDSWAMANLVFDSIWWDEDGIPGNEDKVLRRVPSSLDIAFSVLGNSHTVPELIARMTDPTARQSDDHAVRFRDGLNYQHNLAALREVFDRMGADSWEGSIYLRWLAALRELTAPTSGPGYPESMRTQAWAMKTLNTQLASWTQLRHDSILYAKPSSSGGQQCSFPAGYVECRPAFWARLNRMADQVAGLLEELIFPIEWKTTQENQVAFLRHFAHTTDVLRAIAEKEFARVSLGKEDLRFIRNLLEHQGEDSVDGGCIPFRTYSGWYPQLFYRRLDANEAFHEIHGAGREDFLVTDVHTDVPSPVHDDPGSVLHEAVGKAHLLLIAIETGDQPMVFAGPVLSHFEFELVGPPRRLSDEEWSSWYGNWDEDREPLPDQPSWTRDYLVGHREP